MDNEAAKYNSHQEGLKEGKIEGLKEGKIEGLKEGKIEGLKEGEKNKSIEIAKNMLKKGLDVNTIAELTGLNIEQIEILK